VPDFAHACCVMKMFKMRVADLTADAIQKTYNTQWRRGTGCEIMCEHFIAAFACICVSKRNRNRNLQTSKEPLKSKVQGTSIFMSTASNQRGCPENSAW